MCGIAGIMLREGARGLREGARGLPADTLDKLTAALAHRGPDGQGRYVHGAVAMTQTRLAIVDLETGDQPLFAGAGAGDGPALIANGEIYNNPEIRARIGQSHFKTRSDCEAPLALFAEHGARFAERLRGMYAIALHAPASGGTAERLYLARDPFGIKPLYTAETAYGLAFASEPQALIAAGLIEPHLREGAGEEVLQAQFISGAETAFQGVTRVAPGETLVCEGGRVIERLRRPALPPGGPRRESGAAAAGRLEQLMYETVEIHQRADAPYGMFLSGGIDSAAVLAAMARLNERPVRAFTAGFEGGGGRDETELAARLCAATGAEHEIVTVGADDMRRDLPAVARAMDDPAADYAALPVFALARRAREAGLKVVLTGEGGDEMFAGYGRYRRAVRRRIFGGREMRASGALDGLGLLRDPSRAWRRGIEADMAAADTPGRSALQRVQAADTAGWLPNDLLLKLDRCLMAHGVEGRVPFVDPVMADFAFRLPDKEKIGGKMGKRRLRAWLETALPEAQPWARKQGFTPPVGAWIGEDGARLGALVAAHGGVQEICEPSAVRRVFENAGRDAKAGRAAWAVLFWALWRRAHIEGAPPGGDIYETLGG
ncbi:MAG: asparagine synthase (glutamine-hydrolyzing) [Rhodospirillales bacterium]